MPSHIPEDCTSLAELVVKDLNCRDLPNAEFVRTRWLLKQGYFVDAGAAKPSEEQWIADHSLDFS